MKKQSRLDVRKYSFSQRTINVWNNLSTDCVHASSVNMFKNKIDKYLVEAGYTVHVDLFNGVRHCVRQLRWQHLSPVLSCRVGTLQNRLLPAVE